MPTWSPDGSRIAYISTRDDQDDLFVITLDGSSPIQLTNLPEDEHWPEWSPIGEQIAFKAEADGNNEIYVINADGTSLINLTNHPSADGHPTWSPDSTKIAFTSNRSAYVEIYIMNADGTNIIQVTNFGNVPSGGPQDVSWSPDGQQLAFIMENYEIFTINIDGSGLQQLTRNTIRDDDLDW
jgi:TolB protein